MAGFWQLAGPGKLFATVDDDKTQISTTNSQKLTGQRVMQTFDFEERSIHFQPVPMHWKKVVGKDGFPHFSSGKLDSSFSRSGSYSFELIPDGGSIGFEYDHRRIRAKPGSDFQVTGFVHLENAELCRAQISCQLTDRLGRIITESIHLSRLAGAFDPSEDGWIRLEVYVPGSFPEARYLTVGLWLLQEQQWNQQEQDQTHIFQKNVRAQAWFDDITIYQLPQVFLKTDQPGNLFEPETPVKLQVEVEGVGSMDYHVRLAVRTADGQMIIDESWILTGVEGEKKVRTIELNSLPAGLYRARLEIFSSQTLVTTRNLTFAKLAALSNQSGISGKGFGVIMMDDYSGDWDTTIQLARLLNIKLLKIPVWRRKPEQMGAIFSETNFDKNLISLQRQNIEVVATFSEVPDELIRKMEVGNRSLLDVLSHDVQSWQPQVAGVLAQYARQVPYWQVGGDFNDEQVWDPRIRSVLDTMSAEFDKLVGNTILTVPLNVMLEVNADQVGTSHVALKIPSAITAGQIPEYLQDSGRRGLDNIWTTIEPLDENLYGRDQVLIDLAKRIAFAKKGGSQAVFIDHPWSQKKTNARLVNEPTELFLVYRTLADHLGQLHYAGELNLAPGIPALIFDHDGKGCLFAWNTEFDSQGDDLPQEIELYLGDSPIMVDLLGNYQQLRNRNGICKLRLTNWPVLIGNVDTHLAIMRSSLKLSPAVIDAGISRQHLNLHFVNPFPTSISGQIRFLLNKRQYKNWVVEPSTIPFVLSSGETFEHPIALKFPSNELGGKKQLEALLTIDAERTYKIYASVPFEIRLFGVDVSIFTRRINETDLLIQQVVTNDSDKEINLNSFVDLPDQDYRYRTIPRLQPGATVTKSYLIEKADQWLGKYIRIGLYDPKGTKRINYLIEIN